MTETALILAAVALVLLHWAHTRALLSVRDAGERRVQREREAWQARCDAIIEAAEQRIVQEKAFADQRIREAQQGFEALLDRLQSQSLPEYKAAQHWTAAPIEEPEQVDDDWENPSFARPSSNGRPAQEEVVEVSG